ncbi:MAG TPA: FAD-dependent oxidoreductase, partial [Anaerolineae bacterium]|nr:FAD-dependent oxidoreductase [Anaerolineae bacterium]
MGELIETEILIVGSGIAGGSAALELAAAGYHVTLVTRAAELNESNTYYAQGGIIYRGVDDSPELLAKDILHAGAGYCNLLAVKILSEDGPQLVKQILIDQLGVQFDRASDGQLALALEGGHSIPRIVHAADATGKSIELALMRALKAQPNITLLHSHTAIDLLTPSHHSLNRLTIYDPQSCVGAYLLDQSSGKVIRCLARYTLLAAGGIGQLFLHNTNPIGARGDGIAMAYRAGARVINMEFVQFHP